MAKGRSSSTTVFQVTPPGGPEPLWGKPDWVARRYGLPRYRVFELIKEDRLLFDTICEWPHPNKGVDFMWLIDTLEERDQLAEVGGKEGLSEFFSFVPSSGNATFYCDIVAEKRARRQLIQSCRQIIEASSDGDADIYVTAQEATERIAKISHQNNGVRHKLSGRSTMDFLDLDIDPKTNLLGNRYLTMGSGCFIIAPSGHGKSSIAHLLTISFAIGKTAFGIKPDRPLRILLIQSEDDDADTKKFCQVIRTMKLSEAETTLQRQNTRLEYRNDLTGDDFFNALNDYLTQWPADIVLINPLSGFLMADLKDDEKVSIFLRQRLNKILSKHRCAALIIHHTAKTNFNKMENLQWYDWMYTMSGCATLTNWARAVLVVVPSKIPGTYRFIAAKRFDEIQWVEREYWYSWSTEEFRNNGEVHTIINWVAASEDQIKTAQPEKKSGRPKKNVTAAMVREKMSELDWKTREQFYEWAKETFDIGRDKATDIFNDLDDSGMLEENRTKRAKKRDLVLYRYKKEESNDETKAENTVQ
jgi:hypothetical protein